MAEWVQLRRVRVAGQLLLFVAALWVLGALALSAWLWLDTPISTEGAHGMLPTDLFSKVYGVFALGAAALGLVPLVLGVFMARGQVWAARLGAGIGLLLLLGGAGHVGWGWPSLFVALVGAVISGLPLGAWFGTWLARQTHARSVWASRLAWLCGAIPSIATMLGIAALLVAATTLGSRFGATASESDSRDAGWRSSLTLALQCTHQPDRASPECRELARRAPAAGAAIARAVHDCPVSIVRGTAGQSADDPCAGWRIRGMFTLLGRQHAEEGFVELARWVKRPDAALWLRAAAARALAEAEDKRAESETVVLFETTGAAPSRNGLSADHAFEDSLEAISQLRGPAAIPLLKKILWQHDGQWFGARVTARALAEMNSDESWRTLFELADSPDAARRVLFPAALTGWPTIDPPAVPPLSVTERARQVLLRHLDDEDLQVRLSSCRALFGVEVKEQQTLDLLRSGGFEYRPCDLVSQNAANGSRLRATLEAGDPTSH